MLAIQTDRLFFLKFLMFACPLCATLLNENKVPIWKETPGLHIKAVFSSLLHWNQKSAMACILYSKYYSASIKKRRFELCYINTKCFLPHQYKEWNSNQFAWCKGTTGVVGYARSATHVVLALISSRIHWWTFIYHWEHRTLHLLTSLHAHKSI